MYFRTVLISNFAILDISALVFPSLKYKFTEKEVEFKNQRVSRIQVIVSVFPFEKEIRNFIYQLSVSKSQILDLESLRFKKNKEI